MPLPLVPLIAGAASLGSAAIGAIGQNKANQQNFAFAQQQAQNQMDFQERMINAQNQYNTPLAQMNRFKEAGLNPHLIYGKGTPGNWSGTPSGAKGQANAQNIFQSMGLDGIINSALQARKDVEAIRNVQLNNRGIALKNRFLADTLGYRTQAEYHKTGILSSKEKVDMFSADDRIQSFKLENELKKARKNNVDLDTALKQQTLELQKQGLTWTDPKWMRILVQQAIDAGYPPGQAISWFMENMEKMLGSTIGNVNPF